MNLANPSALPVTGVLTVGGVVENRYVYGAAQTVPLLLPLPPPPSLQASPSPSVPLPTLLIPSRPAPPRPLMKRSSFADPGTQPKTPGHVVKWFQDAEAPRGVGMEKDGSISIWFHGQ